MNIDFVKWMCEKAGWEMVIYDENDIEVIPPNKSNDEDFFTDIGTLKAHYAYALLLQRAFEGVMKESDEDIYMTKNCIKIYKLGDKEKFFTIDGFDSAKEEFLKYRYKQETK